MITLRSKAHHVGCIALVGLFGCTDAQPTSDIADDLSAGTHGIDYSFARPSPATIHADGYAFAVRYLSYDTTGKNISKAEADGLWAKGVDIVSNWEWGAEDSLDGYNEGRAEAQQAQSEAVAAGMPSTRPIYFSIDFDATPAQQAAINDYFDGVASVLGRARTGAYGGYYPVQRLFDAGKITWGWQTYAWSGGLWESRAQLRQTDNGITVAGDSGCCDLDVAEAADIGQWHYTATDTSPTEGSKELAVARNADGRLEVFWMGTGGAINHIWQLTAGGSWSGGAALGGAAKELAVAMNADGRLELFYVGTNNELYHNWQKTAGGAWNGQAALGISGNDIGIGRNVDGRLELVYTETNDDLAHIWQKTAGGAWSGAAALGGAAKDVVVGNHADGALDVIYVGTNNVLYHRAQATPGGSWGAQIDLGPTATDLAVAQNKDGRLEIIDPAPTTGALAHSWETTPNGAWSSSNALGGAAKKVALGVNADGRLEAVYVGTNNRLYHRWQVTAGGGWSSEAALTPSGTALTIATNADGRLEVFYVTTSGTLDHLWQTTAGGAWTGGAPLAGTVTPAAPPPSDDSESDEMAIESAWVTDAPQLAD